MNSDETGGTLVKACALADLEEGEIFQVEVEGAGKLAIYLIEGEVYASSDTCTHGEASLSEDGYIDEFKVVCSWHDGAFDVRSGEPVALPCMVKLKTYATAVRDEDVYVTV